MKEIKYILCFFVFLNFFLGNAQSDVMANKGGLYILPNTVVSTYFDFENESSGIVFNDGEFQFYKNYQNNGMFTHSTRLLTGNAVFKGTVPQELSGSQPSKHANIKFDNASVNYAFQLNNDFIITAKANFNKGIVKINSAKEGALLFTENATHQNTSNKSFAEGTVEKIGNKPFVFPIGSGRFYRSAAIGAPPNLVDSFKASYFLENSNTHYSHQNKSAEISVIDDKEYWTITKDNKLSHVILTLSWNEETTSERLLLTPSDLCIVRWDSKKHTWVNEGGIVDYSDKTVTTPVALQDFGVFTLAFVPKSPSSEIGDVIIYNYVSANGDGKNDHLVIENIEKYPKNSLEIFNRYGELIYKTQGYGLNENYFVGKSESKKTISKNSKLPSGTYYYILNYEKTDQMNGVKNIRKTGFIHLDSN